MKALNLTLQERCALVAIINILSDNMQDDGNGYSTTEDFLLSLDKDNYDYMVQLKKKVEESL